MNGKEVVTPPCVIRDMRADELPAVLDSWVLSALDRRGHDGRRVRVPPKAKQAKRRGILDLLERDGVRVLVAAWDQGDDLLMGWACVEGGTVHYTYVKHRYRRQGIARALVGGLEPPVVCTARPRFGLPKGWRFDRWA